MDKNAIKKFAVWARTELIARVSLKGVEYGITEKSEQWAVGSEQWEADNANGKVFSAAEKKQRQALIAEINDKGYKQVMEEVAYTWFNRFSALRFMEVNGYLPSHVRVFTDEENNFKPQILTEAIHLDLDGLDMERVYALKDAEKTEELYKYLLIVQCNALNKILPGMFQRLSDYTELLLPDNLLREGSVIQQMIKLIPEDDWKDAVQIIGWLYQYYNSEKKDDVFAALKKNVKITKENIPAATQLFTPDWIVRYMVENSLGRLYISNQLSVVSGQNNSSQWSVESERERIEKEKELAEEMGWKYYLPEAEQTKEVREELNKLTADHWELSALKVIDPCSGSGHILAYMFDVLMKIYESYGYTTREAVASIVENNLYGLDIDDRAAQLAYFAVMMKARQYDRRFFSRGIQPHVYAIVESNHVDKFAVDYFCNGDAKLTAAMDTIIKELHDAKEYGSILTVTPQDWSALYDRFAEITEDINISRETALRELLPLVQVAEVLSQKYDVVVTNPPYMGAKSMSPKLAQYINVNYPNTKFDLFSVFIERGLYISKPSGFSCMVTMQSWLFLSSFEKMRGNILNSYTLTNMLHMGNMVMGIAFGTAVSNIRKTHIKKYSANFSFVEAKDISNNSPIRFPIGRKRDRSIEYDVFDVIPGMPIAYWASEIMLKHFADKPALGSIYELKQGLITADNERFLRQWSEVPFVKLVTDATSIDDFTERQGKWLPYNKGGEYRKWYGNNDLVVNWEHEGFEIRNFKNEKGKVLSRPQNIQYFGKEGASWSIITNGNFSLRYTPKGFGFDARGSMMFAKSKSIKYGLALMCSKIAKSYLDFLSPTVSFEVGSVSKVPFIYVTEREQIINDLAERCIFLSKIDWDSFETSWDFQYHPLVSCQQSAASEQKTDHCTLISDHYKSWSQECEQRFNQLKTNEEELNRVFIDIYGLQDELTPEVEDKDVTVHRVFDSKDDVPESMKGSSYVRTMHDEIVSLISYAVGCMFGRYSLDVDGLAYAGGNFGDQWVVVSGQYYKREVVEYYVGKELSRSVGMAEINVGSGRDISLDETASERGAILVIGSDEKGGSVDPFQYRRGTSKKLYEGIHTLSFNSQRLNSGTGNTIYDLCSPAILTAISNGNGNDLIERGWKDAERIDWASVHCALTADHFTPDADNIIPICDDEYFEDDIVGLFVEFVKTVYGAETLDENLKFIADALGGKGQPKDVIRNYFLNDFYSDHCRIYQKRPIYWLFDSGKKNGFKALIYMHRYQPDTIARIRTDYVHEQQARYRTAIADLEQRITNASTGERVKLNKKLTALQAQDTEIRTYEEKIHHLADQMISIDLDDGVKKNYAIFQDVLAKIK